MASSSCGEGSFNKDKVSLSALCSPLVVYNIQPEYCAQFSALRDQTGIKSNDLACSINGKHGICLDVE